MLIVHSVSWPSFSSQLNCLDVYPAGLSFLLSLPRQKSFSFCIILIIEFTLDIAYITQAAFSNAVI